MYATIRNTMFTIKKIYIDGVKGLVYLRNKLYIEYVRNNWIDLQILFLEVGWGGGVYAFSFFLIHGFIYPGKGCWLAPVYNSFPAVGFLF